MIRCAVVLLSVLLWSRGVPARDLTEAEYLASFHARHPARMVLEEDVARARAVARASGRVENPVAGFEREAPGDFGQNTWSLSWRPPLDGRRSAEVSAAEAGIESALGGRALAAAELHAVLRGVYAHWAIADARGGALAAHAGLLRRAVDAASRRAQAGEASQLSARRISFAAVEVDAEAARADATRAEAAAAALGWLGSGARDLEPSLPALPAPSFPDSAETIAVRAKRLELDAARAAERASGRYIQFPELMFGWQTIREADDEISGPVLGVAWALPLFDRRQGDREAARAALDAAGARLDLEAARAAARLDAARESYRVLRDAALAAADSMRSGEAVLAAAVARYEMGESDVTEFLDTVRGVLSARLAALDLYDAALAAHRELDVLLGRAWTPEEQE